MVRYAYCHTLEVHGEVRSDSVVRMFGLFEYGVASPVSGVGTLGWFRECWCWCRCGDRNVNRNVTRNDRNVTMLVYIRVGVPFVCVGVCV